MRKPQRSAVDLTAPLPMGYPAVLDRALELREQGPGWTWAVVADTMRVYHGFDRERSWWRQQLRGRSTSRARGNSFERRAA